ncbi:MAG TPA: Maf family nucleotide pyrophosphatase [Bacteroidales bacterium]|nr:Maf family nucleotide pyrophosphatase [Bacteroidales bacterium]
MILKTGHYQIVLASRSPRRQQLLCEMGIEFTVLEKDFDESFPEGLDGREIAAYIAKQKAQSLKNELKGNEIIITADTVVWSNNKVLGKPADENEAVEMLKEISGKTHEVITGVSMISREKETDFTEVTKVTFEPMTEDEIAYYASVYKPLDKAGAYGIQEWIGLIACSRIEGSYFNVVGLPVHRVYAELKKF